MDRAPTHVANSQSRLFFAPTNDGGGGRWLVRRLNRGGCGGGLRRTRSSHPWTLASRHPWRETVRRNPPPQPPEVVCPPCIGTISQWRMTRHRQCLQDISPDVAVSMSTHQRSRVVALPGASGGCWMHRTVLRQGWRKASAHGWLERVRRIRHPPLAHRSHTAGAPHRRATRKTRSNAIDLPDTRH